MSVTVAAGQVSVDILYVLYYMYFCLFFFNYSFVPKKYYMQSFNSILYLIQLNMSVNHIQCSTSSFSKGQASFKIQLQSSAIILE